VVTLKSDANLRLVSDEVAREFKIRKRCKKELQEVEDAAWTVKQGQS
jgi:hypothetical protein